MMRRGCWRENTEGLRAFANDRDMMGAMRVDQGGDIY